MKVSVAIILEQIVYFEMLWFPSVGIESFSKLGDSIYFEEKGDTPALNIIQYIPSTFNWKAAGLTVTQQVKTLSSSDLYLQVSLSISTTVIIFSCYTWNSDKSICSQLICFLFVQTTSQSAKLNFRIPSWTSADGAGATLNDKDLGSLSPGKIIPLCLIFKLSLIF